MQLERDPQRPLVLWGAGRKGKTLARLLKQRHQPFHWIAGQTNKVGVNIYDQIIQAPDALTQWPDAQVIIAVSSPDGQQQIQADLIKYRLEKTGSSWFFC